MIPDGEGYDDSSYSFSIEDEWYDNPWYIETESEDE